MFEESKNPFKALIDKGTTKSNAIRIELLEDTPQPAKVVTPANNLATPTTTNVARGSTANNANQQAQGSQEVQDLLDDLQREVTMPIN
eukprot:15162326-Ditylum_brightwellii.AAC.1